MKVIVDSIYSIKSQINIDWFPPCKCSLDYDCQKGKMDNILASKTSFHKIQFEPSYHGWVNTHFLDSPINEVQYKKYWTTYFQPCRTTMYKRQDYSDVLKGNESRYHTNKCEQYQWYSEKCWKG